jgi:hypothetical protein
MSRSDFREAVVEIATRVECSATESIDVHKFIALLDVMRADVARRLEEEGLVRRFARGGTGRMAAQSGVAWVRIARRARALDAVDRLDGKGPASVCMTCLGEGVMQAWTKDGFSRRHDPTLREPCEMCGGSGYLEGEHF